MNSCCVIIPGGIGDQILAAPALQALRSEYTIIRAMGHVGALELLQDAGLVDNIMAQGKEDNVYRASIEVIGRLGVSYTPEWKQRIFESLGKPDQLLIYSVDPPCASRGLEIMGVPHVYVANWQPFAGSHASDCYLLALRNLGLKTNWQYGRDSFSLQLPYQTYALPENSVLLSPGSGMTWKRWQLKRYVELAEKLEFLGHNVFALEGPQETGLYKRKFKQVLSGMTLKELTAILMTRPYYIGNDSGTTHLASVLGCPSIAIYGPTAPSEYGPIGERTEILRNCPRLATGSPRVCYKTDCLHSITIESVFTTFERIKNEYHHNSDTVHQRSA